MNLKKSALLAAAVAGIFGAAALQAKESKKGVKKAADGNVPCFGVNKCSGTGKCGGSGKCGGAGGNSCAGSNSCKGQGWLPMPKDSCLAIEGGSLEPIKKG